MFIFNGEFKQFLVVSSDFGTFGSVPLTVVFFPQDTECKNYF